MLKPTSCKTGIVFVSNQYIKPPLRFQYSSQLQDIGIQLVLMNLKHADMWTNTRVHKHV